MSEIFPSFEKSKEISDQELIEVLKAKGDEDPEAFQLLSIAVLGVSVGANSRDPQA